LPVKSGQRRSDQPFDEHSDQKPFCLSALYSFITRFSQPGDAYANNKMDAFSLQHTE
jgi:hypothetical protein